MIVIHNNLIPLGKARTINFFGVLFTKNKNLTPKTENHEAIHTRQQIEWLILYATALLMLIPACGLSWRWLCTVPICYHVVLYPLGPRMVAAAIRHGIPRHSPRAGVLRQPGRSDVSETPQMVRMG